MVTWEYKTEILSTQNVGSWGKTLNARGEEGYELVSVMAIEESDNRRAFVFKRPVED